MKLPARYALNSYVTFRLFCTLGLSHDLLDCGAL